MISVTDRISINYFPNIQDEREHYSSMFMQDFYQTVVPVYGLKKERVICKIKPDNPEFKTLLCDLLPSERDSDKFDGTILDTIRFIARELVNNGQLILELVTNKDYNNKIFYRLECVFGKEIKIKGDKIIQVIHEDAVERLRTTNLIEIPIEKCFIIEFPESIGGKEKYLKFLEEFKELGRQSPMFSYLGNSLRGKPGYDMSEHQRLHELELWKKSKEYNWPHRGNYYKQFSGYYYIYRVLLFRKTQLILRDYIIEQLSGIISKLSECFYGKKAQLEIDGLITTAKIDETIEQWKAGKIAPGRLNEIL
jgi:hypothetical protein